jgi:hypothetical protein
LCQADKWLDWQTARRPGDDAASGAEEQAAFLGFLLVGICTVIMIVDVFKWQDCQESKAKHRVKSCFPMFSVGCFGNKDKSILAPAHSSLDDLPEVELEMSSN